MVRSWHKGLGISVKDSPRPLSDGDTESRLKLTFDEYLELVVHSGFTIISKSTGEDITKDLKLVKVPGKEQDLVGIYDGLNDIVVSTLGHAAEHGMILEPGFTEVMFSNGTKISIDGKKIVNRYIDRDTGLDCDSTDPKAVLLSPNEPVGKILKPESYIKADLKAILSNQGKLDVSQTTVVFDKV
jgi:predicted HAD superfamily Cof-like phosphohydrolase